MRTSRSRLGQSAEIAAAAELGKRGYKIVASNFRCRQGEIDLIANHEDSLVFIEVRCKSCNDYGTPAESVSTAKQRKLITTAQYYLEKHNLWDTACRFDVVEVNQIDGKLHITDVIKNAFSA